MPTLAELITAFRKETEDLVQANVRAIYKYKQGTANLIDGDTVVSLASTYPEEVYSDANEYTIRFIEALDEDGIDISASLLITSRTTTSFTVNSMRAGTLKWQTYLTVPNFTYHT